MEPEYRKIKRHPLAIAWEKWLASEDGKKCSSPETLGTTVNARRYLENRLNQAFMAGAEAVENNSDTKTVSASIASGKG